MEVVSGWRDDGGGDDDDDDDDGGGGRIAVVEMTIILQCTPPGSSGEKLSSLNSFSCLRTEGDFWISCLVQAVDGCLTSRKVRYFLS